MLKKVYITFAISVGIVLVAMALHHSDCANRGLRVDVAKCDMANLRMDSTVVADSELEAVLKPYRDSMAIKMSRKLCDCDEDMWAERPESNLSRFLSDILLDDVRQLAREGGIPEPDFALLNMGGMRSALPKGEIRVVNVFQLAPFENSAVALSLDSAAVCEVMAHIAERGGEAISGASFTVTEDGRVVDIVVGGKPLTGGATYNLATIDYLATGGDDFGCLVGKDVYFQSGLPLRDMLLGHFARMGEAGLHAKAATNVRIKFMNNPKADK